VCIITTVATSIAQRKMETPLAKRSNDINATSTSFKDLVRQDKRRKEESGATDSSDAPYIVQVSDCGEEILPYNEVNTQTRYNVHTEKASDGSLDKNKQKGNFLATEITTQKRVNFQVSTAPEYTIKTKQKRKNFIIRKNVRKSTIPAIQFLRPIDQKHKLREPYLVAADESGKHLSDSKMNPSTHSMAVSSSCLV
jgi:hypothetical protein